jgi:cold shock CspA family protein
MRSTLVLFCVAGLSFALSSDQRKLLHDSGGWEFVTVTDPDSGIQTTHTCFDGHPHPDQCSGTLTFSSSGTFVKNIYIHHQAVQRHGKYELDGDQLVFYDELGTRDGPYTVAIDSVNKIMTLDMPQIHIGLELKSEYRKALKQHKPPAQE